MHSTSSALERARTPTTTTRLAYSYMAWPPAVAAEERGGKSSARATPPATHLSSLCFSFNETAEAPQRSLGRSLHSSNPLSHWPIIGANRRQEEPPSAVIRRVRRPRLDKHLAKIGTDIPLHYTIYYSIYRARFLSL